MLMLILKFLFTVLIIYITDLQCLIAVEFPIESTKDPYLSIIPEACKRRVPADIDISDCCSVLTVFEEKYYTECGFKNFETERIPLRAGDPDCYKYYCVMGENDLLNNDGEIDFSAVARYLDRYVEQYPKFSSSVKYAKKACTADFLPEKDEGCKSAQFMTCLTSTFFAECPGWNRSEECKKLFSHIDTCSMYLISAWEQEDEARATTLK